MCVHEFNDIKNHYTFPTTGNEKRILFERKQVRGSMRHHFDGLMVVRLVLALGSAASGTQAALLAHCMSCQSDAFGTGGNAFLLTMTFQTPPTPLNKQTNTF